MKKKGNGLYTFVLSGDVNVDGIDLSKRDGIGIWNTDSITFKMTTDAELLLMEVPMDA